MNRNSIISFLISSLVLLASVAISTADETNSQHFTFQQFEKDLSHLQSQKFKPTITAHDLAVLKLRAEGAFLPEDSWADILQLWVAGEYDFARLLWWRKDNGETRAFIVALEGCMVTVPEKNAQAWPAGISCYEADAIRFEPQERALRLRETDFVRQNRQSLAKQLSSILSANHVKMAERYKAVAEEATARHERQ